MNRRDFVKSILAAMACFASLAAHADPAPGVKIALELKPGPNNPRNSEGAVACSSPCHSIRFQTASSTTRAS